MTTQKNLPSCWDLWLFDNSDIEETNYKNFFEKIEKVLSVKTTLDFQSFYSQFQKPKNLQSGCEVFFFKEGIKPLWEDPKNKNGGSFFLHIKKTFSNRIWENILLAIVAQEQPELEKINGVIMRILRLEVVFFIWTQDLSITEQKFMIRWLKETAGLSQKIKLEFKPHPKSKKQNNQYSHQYIYLISIIYNEPLSDYFYLQKRFYGFRKRIFIQIESVHFQSQRTSLYHQFWTSYMLRKIQKNSNSFKALTADIQQSLVQQICSWLFFQSQVSLENVVLNQRSQKINHGFYWLESII